MSKTEGFLKEAFAGESQANRQYLAFAEKAEKEGYTQIARLFKAAAEAETVHAINHLKALKAIGTTSENLKTAIDGELHEFEHMYPEMVDAAVAEGEKAAERSFRYAMAVEKFHADLYKGLLEDLGKGQEEYPYFVCPVCGYTVGKGVPDQCPVCGTKGSMFKRID